MSDIDDLLAKARERSAGYGEKYGLKETADDYLKTTYAQLYELIPASDRGSVADKDAWIKRHPDYLAAIERKRNANADWKTAETYMKILLTEAEVWRTKSANDRLMDRGHR